MGGYQVHSWHMKMEQNFLWVKGTPKGHYTRKKCKMALYPKKNAHFKGEDDHQISNLGLPRQTHIFPRLVFWTNGGNKLLQTTERNVS